MRAASLLISLGIVGLVASGPSTVTAQRLPSTVPKSTPPPVPWGALESRPLHLPAVTPGAACPRTRAVPLDAVGKGTITLGRGPLYAVPVGMGNARMQLPGVIGFEARQFDASRHVYSIKSMWISSPRYRGRALIRGRQLDGRHRQVLFDYYVQPEGWQRGVHELRFKFHPDTYNEASQRGWRFQVSGTLIPGPGCYGFQVDGYMFSYSIVFQAAQT